MPFPCTKSSFRSRFDEHVDQHPSFMLSEGVWALQRQDCSPPSRESTWSDG
jgi:hypothetical protein